ncbi:MAG: hypothetical protein HY270_24115 [Deltaproteobacteria bacterium]|nr:hypothetical protein [Deltaproteobacteria bacterium]
MRYAARALLGSLALLALTYSCVPRQPPEPLLPPPPPPPKVLVEEEIKPVERPEIIISDFSEQVSEDRKTATVTGTLINRGNGATHQVTISVSALDKDGHEVDRREATPSTQRIAPETTATFVSTFDRRPEIDHYHVESISR